MSDALLTDLYQLAMLQAYRRFGMEDEACFELFVRKLPADRGFLLAAGLESALTYLERLRFDGEDLDYLRQSGRFPGDFLDWLAAFRFTGSVDAMPEGTVFFPDEPILRVTAPLPQAQLVESRLLNLIHYQVVIASKAVRMVLAAPGKQLVDFGLRRAPGAEAALLAARASYLAGFSGTATVEAERRYGIPLFGTLAHSFIEAHDSETQAFEHFAQARPERLVLLLDTYDTVKAAEKAARLGSILARRGAKLCGVRLDSGDLSALAATVRDILDRHGLTGTTIFASGGLDERAIAALLAQGAPIDGFGVGSSLATSEDAPVLDCAYKLQEYAGLPRRKTSAGKATWPGAKQVWRDHDALGIMACDRVGLAGSNLPGTELLHPAMRQGRRLATAPSLEESRRQTAENLRRLPPEPILADRSYPVSIDEPLRQLAAQCDRRTH